MKKEVWPLHSKRMMVLLRMEEKINTRLRKKIKEVMMTETIIIVITRRKKGLSSKTIMLLRLQLKMNLMKVRVMMDKRRRKNRIRN